MVELFESMAPQIHLWLSCYNFVHVLVEHFVVTGEDHAVFAHVGDDVILNCCVDSHVPVSEIEEVTWKKTDGDESILVLLYQNSEIFPDSSHESYQGRVDFFSSEISKGNFSLQLKKVKMEDKGEFTCEVHTSDMSANTTVVLHGVEHFVVKGADHAVFAHEGDDVILNCSVDSHVPMSEIEEVTWKKTDGDEGILVLLYQNSEIFPDSSHESYQGRVDFFISEITKGNFSLKLKEVTMKDRGEFTCEVHTSDMSARTTVLLHGVVVTKKAMKIHISMILCPNICMIIAFCLWSTEGGIVDEDKAGDIEKQTGTCKWGVVLKIIVLPLLTMVTCKEIRAVFNSLHIFFTGKDISASKIAPNSTIYQIKKNFKKKS
ncbi:hypothetical protein C0J45_2052 [Silurus meridionalis]|nr:hypothetical protein C0J45_2052 [Silurus meridionalis]